MPELEQGARPAAAARGAAGRAVAAPASPAPVEARAPRLARALEPLAVLALAAVAYPLLTSQLPIDDVSRFTPGIAAGRLEWDPAHLWMQPTVVLWHRLFGGTALAAQHAVNVASAALSLAALAAYLRAFGCRPAVRAASLALVAFSFHVLVLATSGHFKLLAMPFLTVALGEATAWELAAARGGRPSARRLALAGVALGVATAYLASSVLAVAAMSVAAAVVSFRARGGAARATRDGATVALAAGATVAAAFALAYLVQPGPASAGGFLEFATATQARGRGGPTAGLAESTARLAFGLALNFVWLEDLGSVLRARMSGALPSLAGYGRELWIPSVLCAGALVGLAVLARTSLRAIRDRAAAGALAWAQAGGMLAFAAAWNLTEPDFYFPATAPLVLAAALCARTRAQVALLALAALAVGGSNLATYSLPRRPYPLVRHGEELAREFGPRDLVISFQDYPGGPYLGFFAEPLADVPAFWVDEPARLHGRPETIFADLHAAVDEAFLRGGRAVVFRVLDERDWKGPWAVMRMRGWPKERVRRELEERYEVRALGEKAGIPCWELRARVQR